MSDPGRENELKSFDVPSKIGLAKSSDATMRTAPKLGRFQFDAASKKFKALIDNSALIELSVENLRPLPKRECVLGRIMIIEFSKPSIQHNRLLLSELTEHDKQLIHKCLLLLVGVHRGKINKKDLEKMSTKTALIIGSNGSEDIELIVTSDILRRAGIDVTIGGLQDQKVIELARRAKLEVDALFKDVAGKDFDAVILPGGQPGSDNLAKDPRVGEMLKRHEKAGKIVAAICAAPIAFASHGIAKNGKLTAYPSVKDKLVAAGYTFSEHEKVCVHNGNVVTSKGPGTAFDFALKLVELLVDAEKADNVKNALLHGTS